MIRHQVVEPLTCIGYSRQVTDTTLAIASVLEPQDYRKFDVYRELYVDNGAFEIGTGYQVDFDNVIDKQITIANRHAELELPTYLSLPDKACDYLGTARLFHQYYFNILRKINKNIKFVVIPQGANISELAACIQFFQKQGMSDFKWGFSCLDRRYLKRYFEHEDMFEWFASTADCSYKDIHCLGFELDDLKYEGFYHCDSFDSAYALKALQMGFSFGEDKKRPADYFTWILDRKEVVKQVDRFINWIAVSSG